MEKDPARPGRAVMAHRPGRRAQCWVAGRGSGGLGFSIEQVFVNGPIAPTAAARGDAADRRPTLQAHGNPAAEVPCRRSWPVRRTSIGCRPGSRHRPGVVAHHRRSRRRPLRVNGRRSSPPAHDADYLAGLPHRTRMPLSTKAFPFIVGARIPYSWTPIILAVATTPMPRTTTTCACRSTCWSERRTTAGG